MLFWAGPHCHTCIRTQDQRPALYCLNQILIYGLRESTNIHSLLLGPGAGLGRVALVGASFKMSLHTSV